MYGAPIAMLLVLVAMALVVAAEVFKGDDDDDYFE